MTIAPPDYQMTLLSVAPSYRITKNAQARNAYGTVAAEIVCAALSLAPVRINGSYDACFDAFDTTTGLHYEIKSVKHGGKVVVYDWRRAKEERAGDSLRYAILCHGVKGSDGRALADEMAASQLKLVMLPAADVHDVAARQPLRKLLKLALDPRNGYARVGYAEGYRNVPVAALLALATRQTTLQCRYGDLRFPITLCQRPQHDP